MKRTPIKAWKILNSKYLLKNRWLIIRQDRCQLPNGQIINGYYVREDRDVATIFCLTADKKVVLNRQYKHGIKKVVLEIPAGMIEKGESAKKAALRELAEETGYQPKRIRLLAKLIVNPTINTNYNYIFLATGAKLGCGKVEDDPKEKIQNELVPLSKLETLIRTNKINVQWSIAAIYLVLDYLKRNNKLKN